jgi:hypothetical protein
MSEREISVHLVDYFVSPDAGEELELKAPHLLRVPEKLHTVDDVLACAGKMDLPNVFVLAERKDGKLVFLTTSDMSGASINWILDRAQSASSSSRIRLRGLSNERKRFRPSQRLDPII